MASTPHGAEVSTKDPRGVPDLQNQNEWDGLKSPQWIGYSHVLYFGNLAGRLSLYASWRAYLWPLW
jgi:hypothetical protein